MEPNHSSRSNLKRPRITEDSDSDSDADRPTAEKRVRFPKGKKAKHQYEPVNRGRAPADEDDDDETELEREARAVAKEREKRRLHRDLGEEDDIGEVGDVTAAEVSYEGLDGDNFVEDGIKIEPFNLDKEREEGYFDDNGNFVEYAPSAKNQAKDAWLDSIEADGMKVYAQKPKDGDDDDDGGDLGSDEDIGKIKRRIADVLEEGETVLQALRRLKGDKKVKMSGEAKKVFDQLTEDALTLMDKYGEYDVNQEKKEIFEREAQGYESLARARSGGGIALITDNNGGVETAEGEFDMFGEDDDGVATTEPSSADGGGDGSSSQLQNDYVFDEASGYYYSSSLGYYYDATTGLYCSAASGIWYSYNEATGAYDEVTPHDQAAAADATATGVN